MLHFEGDKDFPQPPAEVAGKLADAGFLVACIPGIEKVSKAEPREAQCVLRPGFAFVRGTLDLTLQLLDSVPGSSFRLLLHSKGIGSTSDVEALITISARDAGSRVH